MFNRKACKKTAKANFRKHYLLFVFLCLFAAMIGTEYTTSYKWLTDEVKIIATGGDEDATNFNSKWQINEAVTGILNNQEESKEFAAGLLQKEKKQKSVFIGKHVELGNYKGVLAKIRNQALSGSFIVTAASALTSVLGSSKIAVAVLGIFATLLVLFVRMFFINVYNVIYARMFLEGRIYKKVPIQRIAFLIYIRKWGKAALTMLVKNIYQSLWFITVIGGIIKSFSYFAVSYIVAENPDVGPLEAISLSRKMMDGHKWECFKLKLSFLGWDILNMATFGISGILFSNPYLETTLCEYYTYIRQLAKENEIEGIGILNDTYLYELPPKDLIAEQYGDYAMYEVEEKIEHHSLKDRMSDFFGVYVKEENYEKEKELLKQTNRYDRIKHILKQEEYDLKLYPIPEKKKRNILEYMHFDRKYSVWTLFLFFVFFSNIGWLWEVSLHLISDGEFVNRGTLHGPYLPIYGTGAVVILLGLKKLRNHIGLEFAGAVLLCGIVEYTSAYVLELLHNGEKWWNYTGYFLNFDGRVCAEGLLVFGLGGMVIVYFLAPLFDNLVRRIPHKKVLVISAILFVIVCADFGYSSVHPNTGKGITDYKSHNVQMIEKG